MKSQNVELFMIKKKKVIFDDPSEMNNRMAGH